MAALRAKSLEYVVAEDGSVLDGKIEPFVELLMNGGQLCFRALSNPPAQQPEVLMASGEKINLSRGPLLEAYTCRSFFVVPARNYFAGLIGPLYCAIQSPDAYIPNQKMNQPMYAFQSCDCLGNNSVRHFFTHPDFQKRPSDTARYDPVRWKVTARYTQVLHLDRAGEVISSDMEALRAAVVDGRKHFVLVRNPYTPLIQNEPLTDDYWMGGEFDLVQFYPEQGSAAGQILNTFLFAAAIPLRIEHGCVDSMFIDTRGQVAHIRVINQQPHLVETTGQEKIGADVRIHVTQGIHREQNEIRWFVED